MNKYGTKLYYCSITGNPLVVSNDIVGFGSPTTFEEDCLMYTALKERDINSIGLLQFEYGEYPKLSKGSTGVKVDLETKELIFSYEELPQIPTESTEIEMLANKISILECENKALKEELTQIQASIASLTSLIAVTLEEK